MAGIFLLTLALFVLSVIRGDEISGFTNMPFYRLIFGQLHQIPVLNRFIALSLMFLIGYMLIRIGARYVLLPIRSFMPALFFILFTAVLPESRQVSPALVGSVFYLFCFAIIFDVSDKPPDTFSIFSAGLVLALGSMFYLKLVWFLPLIWISLISLRAVNLRELFYPVIAFLLLGLFLFTWYWGIKDDGDLFLGLISENLAFDQGATKLFHADHFSVLIYYGYFLLLIIVASIFIINRFQTRKTVVQNIYQVLFYMFVAGILFFALVNKFDPATLVYVAIPCSYLLANYLHQKKSSWLHELIMWVFLGLVIFVQWMF